MKRDFFDPVRLLNSSVSYGAVLVQNSEGSSLIHDIMIIISKTYIRSHGKKISFLTNLSQNFFT